MTRASSKIETPAASASTRTCAAGRRSSAGSSPAAFTAGDHSRCRQLSRSIGPPSGGGEQSGVSSRAAAPRAPERPLRERHPPTRRRGLQRTPRPSPPRRPCPRRGAPARAARTAASRPRRRTDHRPVHLPALGRDRIDLGQRERHHLERLRLRVLPREPHRVLAHAAPADGRLEHLPQRRHVPVPCPLRQRRPPRRDLGRPGLELGQRERPELLSGRPEPLPSVAIVLADTLAACAARNTSTNASSVIAQARSGSGSTSPRSRDRTWLPNQSRADVFVSNGSL